MGIKPENSGGEATGSRECPRKLITANSGLIPICYVYALLMIEQLLPLQCTLCSAPPAAGLLCFAFALFPVSRGS